MSRMPDRVPNRPPATRARIGAGVRVPVAGPRGEGGHVFAPLGEYTLARLPSGAVAFEGPDGARFTLSIDAVIQHCGEGRMRLLGGARLPE